MFCILAVVATARKSWSLTPANSQSHDLIDLRQFRETSASNAAPKGHNLSGYESNFSTVLPSSATRKLHSADYHQSSYTDATDHATCTSVVFVGSDVIDGVSLPLPR